MNTMNGEKVSSHTWLLIFCIFNLVLTLALFGVAMRKTANPLTSAMMNRSARNQQILNQETYRGIKRPMMSGATMASGTTMMSGVKR